VVVVKILSGSQPEGRGSAPVVVSECRIISLLSVAGERRNIFIHVVEKKRQTNA
jgi:hypothetical protein